MKVKGKIKRVGKENHYIIEATFINRISFIYDEDYGSSLKRAIKNFFLDFPSEDIPEEWGLRGYSLFDLRYFFFV